MSEVKAVSPIDGRYRNKIIALENYFSEEALIRHRIIVEVEYLIALSEVKGVGIRKISPKEIEILRKLYLKSEQNAEIVKNFEATTNHDVKAVEYFIKEKLKNTSTKDLLEWIHFALTSEDINNVSYAIILSSSMKDVIIPEIQKIQGEIEKFAKQYKSLPMLARTHGQSASPTTLGKEFEVFNFRLKRQINRLGDLKIQAKLNGATGNYNAHIASHPKIKWPEFSKKFINKLSKTLKIKLEPNLITTQIESHDSYVELFDILKHINTILIGFNQDVWRYISDNWIIQKPKDGEVGSSTMPHKINPIDFENSEGNLGMANALFGFFSQKLPISRLQRDLSDSTVERNFGSAFAYSLIAYKSLLKGLGKIRANEEKIVEDLESHVEVIAEAIQTILRREGVAMPYEELKKLTRGKKVTMEDFKQFIQALSVSEKIKKELLQINPKNYIGLASSLFDFET